MSERLNLSIMSAVYDRVQALMDGRVRIEGCDHTFMTAGHEQMFFRAFETAEYDIAELSMGSYITAVARGENKYVAIPVFLSRIFRHSAIYYNADAGISSPADLIGKKMGVPEYQMTAALWARGFLDDEYGVSPNMMHWFQGGLDEPGRYEKVPLTLPSGTKFDTIAPDKTLDAMLVSGEIDALISARTPKSFSSGSPNVKRMFPDYPAAEKAYYAKTKVFPIMHVVGIRRELVDKHPWLPNAVFDAFCAAKDFAVDWFSNVAALRVTLPWFDAQLDETKRLMGPNFWPYGISANKKTLSLMLDYSYRHGLTDRLLTLEDLFAPSTFVEVKV
ncbi:PhnD/SsuA/transferrin family substrate-binding protein [Sphingobium sp. SCG-1]|uniref:PhnD/SsuA/transferrin family substrate-binding protein n=1 Tax=Sphingobium sp. SCG-1 TaxID=2072936 RepID=UPI001CB90D75|nr:PhnD/SsuA/transferrin family substrate-binding protein [Sphingobium sp. SCG-1]